MRPPKGLGMNFPLGFEQGENEVGFCDDGKIAVPLTHQYGLHGLAQNVHQLVHRGVFANLGKGGFHEFEHVMVPRLRVVEQQIEQVVLVQSPQDFPVPESNRPRPPVAAPLR